MVGMLQIITYLLCLYLVFKGFEILQIALMSAREDRAGGITIGVLLLVVSLAGAWYFVHAIDAQAASVASRQPQQ
jgi:hypothetical protein